MKIMMNSGRIGVFFTTRFKLVQAIRDKGYDVTIGGYEQEKKNLCVENDLRFAFIPFSRAGINPIADLKTIRYYEKIMKREKFDIVHSYTAKPNIYGSIAAKRVGIKRIFPTVNGLGYAFTDEDNTGIKKRIIRFISLRLYKQAFSCATKVFFQNPDDADEMIRRGTVSRDKCIVIDGSGVDLEKFPYVEPSTNPMHFLMATRLLISKGVRTFLEAAKIVKEQYPDVEFTLAGSLDPNPDGIKKNELNPYIEQGVITYLGHVVNMPMTLSNCSVFVLPSYYREGIPRAVLEAMSTGRAIITCNTPGCRETVHHANSSGQGINGFLIQPKNPWQLVEKMIWMIQNPKLVEQMGMESRKYAEERFDVSKVNRQILEEMGIS